MINDFQEFQKLGNLKISNNALDVYIKQYQFLYVFQQFLEDKNKKIFDNFIESNVVIVNFFDEDDSGVYMITFKKTVILIKKTDLFFLNSLFSRNQKCKICFLSEKERVFFTTTLNTSNIEIEFTEKDEYDKMNKKTYKDSSIYLNIRQSIICYIIKQSYLKLNVNRIDDFFKNSEKICPEKNLNKNDFIFVKNIGLGSSSTVNLYFHLQREEFFVIKSLWGDLESQNLNIREAENYKEIMNHPFLPKFYGNDKEYTFLAMEYIYGEALLDIKNLKNNEKITIIFELMLIIEYFHRKKMIIRDLKPDNIMIDKNKTVVLIDFNRTIKFMNRKNQISYDINSIWAADELFSNSGYSYNCDIYSLGKIIYFIMEGETPTNENLSKEIFFGNEYSKIAEVVKKCTQIEPKKRPLIFDLIIDFYITYHSDINVPNLHKIFDMDEFLKINDFWQNPENITELVLENVKVETNINKAIQFYLLTADQNDPETQNKFGALYLGTKFVKQDIKKALNYLELAAKKDHIKSLHNLGCYYNDKGEFQKSIEYYTRAANLGYPESQYNLSLILLYYNKNEAIKYLKLASDNNFMLANYVLGNLCIDICPCDVKSAIHFYTLAADNGHDLSQYNLGNIYFDIIHDVEKAIKYFTLAADQNFCEAQINLGFIYCNDKYGKQDINKSIQYWTKAANLGNENASKILQDFIFGTANVKYNMNESIQKLINAAQNNDVNACFKLGLIYSKSEYDKLDIQKAIYYFKKAADKGHKNSQYNLGVLYIDKKSSIFDLNKGINYINSAADQNYLAAITKLGNIYINDNYGIKDVEKGIYYLTKAADKDDLEASIILGEIYFEGKIVNYDFHKAINYLSIAADFNNMDACYKLGLIYLKEKNIESNVHKAIKYFKKAADKGHLLSQHELGNIYHDKSLHSIYDIDKSIHYYSQSANQGFSISQYNLGIIFMENSKYDISKSIKYFKMAAEQNHMDSILNLAAIFFEDKLVERNIDEAIYYFNKAAQQNHKQSQFNLGKLYYEGKLVTRDIEKAISYLTKAANQNLPDAQYILGIIYYHVEFGKSNIYKSIQYLESASNQNFGEASFALGQIYYEGQFVDRNIKKSIHYLQIAINQNINKAYFYIGLLYLGGKYINQDFNKAFECFLCATKDNNFPIAQFYVGMMYMHFKDYQNGIKYLKLAEKQNYLDAKFNLGHIYYHGFYGIPKDIQRAIYYYEDAAQKDHPQSQCELGRIYCDSKSKLFNIEKGIHYYLLSAKQNFVNAQYNLGCVYLSKQKNIDKAVHYLQLAANKGLSQAQYKLGLILYKKNINMAIYYFKKASDQNNSDAQFMLGNYYFKDENSQEMINKGIEFYENSSKNGNIEASFIVGFLYHKGKNLDRNLTKAISFYKKASSFNHQFAKNNLAILFKYGYDHPNIYISMVYLNDAIKQKQDHLAMYNLAHIYFYQDPEEFKNNYDELKINYDGVIKLLIEPTKDGFIPAEKLLCLALIKYCDSSFQNIEIYLKKYDLNYLSNYIQGLIKNEELYNDMCKKFEDIDYLYDLNHAPVLTKSLLKQKPMKDKDSLQKNLTQEFYNGFDNSTILKNK